MRRLATLGHDVINGFVSVPLVQACLMSHHEMCIGRLSVGLDAGGYKNML